MMIASVYLCTVIKNLYYAVVVRAPRRAYDYQITLFSKNYLHK